jgi:hypothetical protein
MNRILLFIFASLGIVQIDAMQSQIALAGLKKLTATVAHIGLSAWPIRTGAKAIYWVAAGEDYRNFWTNTDPNITPAKRKTVYWVQKTLGDKSVIKTVVIDSKAKYPSSSVGCLRLPSAIEGPNSNKEKSFMKPFLAHENAHGVEHHILKQGLINIAMPLCHFIGLKIFPSYARIIMKNGLTKIGSGLVNSGLYTLIQKGVSRYHERQADLAITDLDGAIKGFEVIEKRANPSGLPIKTGWFDNHDSTQQRIATLEKRKKAAALK